MTTINQVCKAVVNTAIDSEFFGALPYTTPALRSVYLNEYGSWNGTTPKACTDYLQGLPSVCTVPFYNNDILSIFEGYGIMRKSSKGQEKLIDDYWKACGNAFYNLVK